MSYWFPYTFLNAIFFLYSFTSFIHCAMCVMLLIWSVSVNNITIYKLRQWWKKNMANPSPISVWRDWYRFRSFCCFFFSFFFYMNEMCKNWNIAASHTGGHGASQMNKTERHEYDKNAECDCFHLMFCFFFSFLFLLLIHFVSRFFYHL